MTAALEHNPPAPAASMILMHGLGASGDDLSPLAPHLGGGRLRVVCPHAPVRAVTVNGGAPMRAWYDIVGADLQSRQDSAGVAESAAFIEAMLAAEKNRGFAASQIYVAGFSQGAALALHVGMRHAEALAGVVALSGYLLFADELSGLPADGRRAPIFQAHGAHDGVVLPAWARDSRDALRDAGYALTYREYPVAHGIAPAAIADLNVWLETTNSVIFAA